jgi:hypothetical protein
MAEEKYTLLEKFGASIIKTRPASIVNPEHYCKVLLP